MRRLFIMRATARAAIFVEIWVVMSVLLLGDYHRGVSVTW
jgi:hypothetical protein